VRDRDVHDGDREEHDAAVFHDLADRESALIDERRPSAPQKRSSRERDDAGQRIYKLGLEK